MEALTEAKLPAAMQVLPPAEGKEFAEQKSKECTQLQAKINRLNAAREKLVAARINEVATTDTLDGVVVTTVREQARTREFKFE